MAKAKKAESVPKAMQEKFDRIVAITDGFSQAHLNDEYAQLIRFAVAALCRKRPSPVAKGRDRSWACGVTHALGMVNFLFDPSQEPHISAGDLYKAFGVSQSTGQAKSKTVRDILKMYQMDPNWSLPSNIDRNPMVWMLEVNGFIMDIRSAPRELQEMAFNQGLIPYIPDDGPVGSVEKVSDKKTGKAKAGKAKADKASTIASTNSLYVLDVNLMGGPISDDFIEKNPFVQRTIEIKGNQTLADLHQAIFDAFDREEEHLYEFQVGGQRPNDPNAERYGPNFPGGGFEELEFQDAAEASLASLGLSPEDIFGYHFDFGDDWWHQINVMEVQDKAPKGKYPKVTKREGASPPQYDDAL